jgi:anion-transporting  ArsA/GET3 family ATPase
MGKVWYEERKRDAETQQPRWDILIVDMPATGHSLQYLRMPRAARDTFGVGLVRRESERILTLFRDPQKTAVNLVTIPEELPVSETQETYRQLAEDLVLPFGVLFINRVHSCPLPSAALASARINPRASSADRRLAEQTLTSAQAEAALAEAQTSYVRQLLQLPLPSLQIPFCFAEQFGLPEVEQIAQVIAGPFAERTREKGEKGKRRRGEASSRSA